MIDGICLCQPESQAREKLRVCWSFTCSQVNIGERSFQKQHPFAFSWRFLEQQEIAGKGQACKQISTVQSNTGHRCCHLVTYLLCCAGRTGSSPTASSSCSGTSPDQALAAPGRGSILQPLTSLQGNQTQRSVRITDCAQATCPGEQTGCATPKQSLLRNWA